MIDCVYVFVYIDSTEVLIQCMCARATALEYCRSVSIIGNLATQCCAIHSQVARASERNAMHIQLGYNCSNAIALHKYTFMQYHSLYAHALTLTLLAYNDCMSSHANRFTAVPSVCRGACKQQQQHLLMHST
jgi:hypothetical protein